MVSDTDLILVDGNITNSIYHVFPFLVKLTQGSSTEKKPGVDSLAKHSKIGAQCVASHYLGL